MAVSLNGLKSNYLFSLFIIIRKLFFVIVGILLFAEAHGCVDLRSAAEIYIHNHFLKVAEEEEYSNIPKDLLVKLLNSEHLRVDNEFQVDGRLSVEFLQSLDIH